MARSNEKYIRINNQASRGTAWIQVKANSIISAYCRRSAFIPLIKMNTLRCIFHKKNAIADARIGLNQLCKCSQVMIGQENAIAAKNAIKLG